MYVIVYITIISVSSKLCIVILVALLAPTELPDPHTYDKWLPTGYATLPLYNAMQDSLRCLLHTSSTY